MLDIVDFASAPRGPRASGERETSRARASADSPSAEPSGAEIGLTAAERKRASGKNYSSKYTSVPGSYTFISGPASFAQTTKAHPALES